MEYTLKINGMHCSACSKLINMELEDAGFGSNILSLDLGVNNSGELKLKNINENDLVKIKEVINSMETYSV